MFHETGPPFSCLARRVIRGIRPVGRDTMMSMARNGQNQAPESPEQRPGHVDHLEEAQKGFVARPTVAARPSDLLGPVGGMPSAPHLALQGELHPVVVDAPTQPAPLSPPPSDTE
jgi:hypothetical protein